MKTVRMLVDHEVDGLKYKVNQVVSFPDGTAKVLVNGGVADASKEAVDYCKSELKAEPIVHVDAAERAAKAEVISIEAQLKALEAEYNAETDAGKRAAIGKRGEALNEQLAAAKAKLDK
jgi:hypothetical protein